ncbi:hypothetical protein [Gorillibacterium sp. sgz5001074]|uniref:hypothetical protein n=1 Tax=Gorillibacterium sp. sgz5001074 TaxID=3446695 RepID=UPI003F671A4C
MDIQLFEEALEKLQTLKVKGDISSSHHAFFMKYNVPENIREFYNKFSFTESLKFRHNYFYNLNDIVEENTYYPNNKCVASELLIIGHGLNGDYIVMNMKSNCIGFIFHDDLYENEDTIIEDINIDTGMSVGNFYYKSVTEDNFPVDGYQAEQYFK